MGFRLLFAACTIAAVIGCAAAEPERIAYPLEDFEAYTPGLWNGRNDIKASIRELRENGNRAVMLEWDFRDCADSDMQFANMVMHRPLSGRVQSVSARIDAPRGTRGTTLTLWIEDSSGEMYVSRRQVDREGPQQVEFNVASVPPGWESGDRNGRQDLPLKLFGISVESATVKTGTIVIDDISVLAQATPEEALGFRFEATSYRNWGPEQPRLRVKVANYSKNPFGMISGQVVVRDLYSGREEGPGRPIHLDGVPGLGSADAEALLTVPYGAFEAELNLVSAGVGIRVLKTTFLRLPPAMDPSLPTTALEAMAESTSFGGVMGAISPELAGRLGARWIRLEHPTWADAETAPGEWDFSAYPGEMAAWSAEGVRPVLLQTLYQKPAFRTTDQLAEFAGAYGDAVGGVARTAGGVCTEFELGNEDNGPTKFVYTEIARHGAAAVRAAQPLALIATSGTAFVDATWLEMQAGRGLLDGIDALCVHPYTNNSTPRHNVSAATFRIHEQIQDLTPLADRLGGMKSLWATEFGWPNADRAGEAVRADLYPRHMLVGAGAGLDLHGLYTWDRDYGITGRPAEVSVHALLGILAGHRFVGWLHRQETVWAGIWERGGRPRLAAWSPAGAGRITVRGTAESKVLDLFGNTRADTGEGQTIDLSLGHGPAYITDVDPSVLEQAAQIRGEEERNRLRRCLDALPPTSTFRLDPGIGEQILPPDQLADSLLLAIRSSPAISTSEQAVVAAILRLHEVGVRYGETNPKGTPDPDADAADLRQFLNTKIAEDVDVPAIRWILRRDERLAAESRLHEQDGNARYAARLQRVRSLGLTVGAAMRNKAPSRCFSLWPYLFAREGGKATETLTFVPGLPTTVTVRVNSYSRRQRTCAVALDLPAEWTCDPPRAEVAVPPHGRAETQLRITPAATVRKAVPITARLTSENLPEVALVFDNVRLLPSVGVHFLPLAGIPGKVPARLVLTTREGKPISGLIRLLDADGDGRALARQRFEDLEPNETRELVIELPEHAGSTRALTADIRLTDGREMSITAPLEFTAAQRHAAVPAIDGVLTEWQGQLPLRLNRAEYAHGSYGGNWSPEDGSATTYMTWTPGFIHFAAEVKDQTFNQQHRDESTWNQDSIQIIFAADTESAFTEFTLALTPDGPCIWSSAAREALPPPSRLAVKLIPGGAVYEATIAVSAITDLPDPRVGGSFRFGVALNDHDAVGTRKFLERFSGSIVHGKDVKSFAPFAFIGPATPPNRETAPILLEDFEEYPAPALPDAWQRLVSRLPEEDVAATGVRAGMGHDGSKGLVLVNTVGDKPHHYVLFVRELQGLRPQGRYLLTAWVRCPTGVEKGSWLGICSDLWGNENFSYVEAAPPTDWQQVKLEFTAPPAGRCNVIIRNHSATAGLQIDDLQVTPVPAAK